MKREVSAERYLVGAMVISVITALVASRFPVARFDSALVMAIVLIGADLVVYLLMKAGAFSRR